ncbi:hypothetical protein AB1Y20_015190 [Prymnesium parvum]|uniref:Dihydroorotase n=1 Tax=Prymnesium parvum TaxID=97485 RepID=A0AB34K0M9_PRYPA
MAEAQQLSLIAPDDFHHHLRDGAVLSDTANAAARQFSRALVMPNLVPPVTTAAAASEYKTRILSALSPEARAADRFRPLMTMYLTDETTPEEIKQCFVGGDVKAVKLYPAGATTNSASGVTDYEKITPALQAMQHYGLPLCIHGEVTDPAVDIFDRERVFIEKKLPDLLQRASQLRVVLEHMTTKEAAQFVLSAGPNVAATITPQHLLVNRNAMLAGGIRPHLYCLPILKTEEDRVALVGAATSGHPRIFLGTDSAPHAIGKKEAACGCAGVFSAHSAIELYAEAFEQAGALDKLEAFSSVNGAAFYGLEVNQHKVTLALEPWKVPDSVPFGDSVVVPFGAGTTLRWKLQHSW